jgi:hypothetical protein
MAYQIKPIVLLDEKSWVLVASVCSTDNAVANDVFIDPENLSAANRILRFLHPSHVRLFE